MLLLRADEEIINHAIRSNDILFITFPFENKKKILFSIIALGLENQYYDENSLDILPSNKYFTSALW